MQISLNQQQEDVLERSGHLSVFLEGPPGSGKTTVGVAHMKRLIKSGVPAASVLVLLPQRTLGVPYYEAISEPGFHNGGSPSIVTFGGLARRMVSLFWPLIAANAGFANPDFSPLFLTLETAQYYASKLIQPLLDEHGFFNNITINRNRLYSQILDNLNKSAVTGIPVSDLGDRLKSAWVGQPEQLRVYEEVQISAEMFRGYCLENNLLDYSLQIETFNQHLWTSRVFQSYFYSQFRYIIFDNIEEDVPVVHDMVAEWSPHMDSCFFIFDQDGGYRLFLGADPISGYRLKDQCNEHNVLGQSLVQSPEIIHLQESLTRAIWRRPSSPSKDAIDASLKAVSQKYYPDMVNWIAGEVHHLIQNGTDPGEISIISPFLSDSLRFEFSVRFEELSIPYMTHRPSRSLKDEPATSCLLTLVKMIHTDWNMFPSLYEFRSMLMQAITGFDLVRADILTKIVYRASRHDSPLGSFDDIKLAAQERITYTIGERYETLRRFINEHRETRDMPLDILISIIFSELLSQPGFGFYRNLDAAETTSRLMESFLNFKSVYVEESNDEESLAHEYVEMIQQGVLAAQYLESWELPQADSVFLSPAHTFLMANRPVDYQFWLDIGSLGWWERLNQPLTHPYVLSRQWPEGKKWTDQYEYEYNQTALERLVKGLLYRCRRQVTLCITEINEQGLEQRGPLLHAVQSLYRSTARAVDGGVNGRF